MFTDAKNFREEAYRYFDRNMLYTPWNKLYRMDVIRQYGLYFPKTLWDDFPFNLSYLDHVENVVFSTNAYYHFIRARAESETAAYRADMYEKRGRTGLDGRTVSQLRCDQCGNAGDGCQKIY